MKMKKWLLIDGYNLIFQLPAGRQDMPPDMAGKRQRLLRMLDDMAGVLADRVTVIFDGRSAAPGDATESPHVEIIFSPPDKTADTVIEQLVCGTEHPEKILVVTSDRRENETIRAAGAEVMSCAAFLDHLHQERENLGWLIQRRTSRAPANSLGDFFPPVKLQDIPTTDR
ncbi:MAG: NYN domain-containing protein [Verrucomicrobia bacterium]|nr:NYN domain-containing protein [Verrucomicrobiota bacterium]MBU4291086.1 NYN domain-containing protein [Verrucomicrobiota bacterium]MBU4429364.1 NYN domain-containing protein [Verrucomicrobiota bacterium]MBU4498123.1 NYN domain-containing protein [Verrucomicrobiota bacterium]MCG2680103.1 NYN domain-containing protein [Kiritimatiellia bacterium]